MGWGLLQTRRQRALIVRVPVVQVGKMRMPVDEPGVAVPVRVRLPRRDLGPVRVLVVLVMDVGVLML